MTEFSIPPRRAALSVDAIVVSNNPTVSSAGLAALRAGGNAIDATLSMAAMCWLALPGQCGPGGDAFAIVREPDGLVWTLGASGFGPDGGVPSFYRNQGLGAIPLSGALAVAGAGAMAAILALHGAGATRSLTELWAPALDAAERGVPCTERTRLEILSLEAELRLDAGLSKMFLQGGRAPRVGARLIYSELAESMRLLASEPECLYHGELGERALAALVAAGAPFSGAEWEASGVAFTGPAISHPYGSITVHETPPPSPGWMVLQQAAICNELLPNESWLGLNSLNVFVGAARQAFRDRRDRCGSDTDVWQKFLTREEIAAARARLGDSTPDSVGVDGEGDTTSTIVVDSDGRTVSFIQSLALTFGANITVPGTGITLNSRLGRGCYLADGHPNEVKPRRRPLHTLNAWLATDEVGRLRHVGNTPGGDGQVQWNMQVLSHLVDFGLDPQEAVSAPRFSISPGSDASTIAAPDEVICESRIEEGVRRRLAMAGHNIRTVGPWQGGGAALAISVDHQLGCLFGGVDPRQDGVALGI